MSRHEWGFVNDALWRVKKIRAALDARFADVPMIQHRPIPSPEGHPDLDTFDADMAEIARLGRQLWSEARFGEPTPAHRVGVELTDSLIYDEMLTELDAFSAAPQLHLAIDQAAFDLIADDIAAWRLVAG